MPAPPVTDQPCRHVYQLPADHSLLLSTPVALTECLHDAATRFGTGAATPA